MSKANSYLGQRWDELSKEERKVLLRNYWTTEITIDKHAAKDWKHLPQAPKTYFLNNAVDEYLKHNGVGQ